MSIVTIVPIICWWYMSIFTCLTIVYILYLPVYIRYTLNMYTYESTYDILCIFIVTSLPMIYWCYGCLYLPFSQKSPCFPLGQSSHLPFTLSHWEATQLEEQVSLQSWPNVVELHSVVRECNTCKSRKCSHYTCIVILNQIKCLWKRRIEFKT